MLVLLFNFIIDKFKLKKDIFLVEIEILLDFNGNFIDECFFLLIILFIVLFGEFYEYIYGGY